jgi:carboxypeptidase C (cathepsin A)
VCRLASALGFAYRSRRLCAMMACICVDCAESPAFFSWSLLALSCLRHPYLIALLAVFVLTPLANPLPMSAQEHAAAHTDAHAENPTQPMPPAKPEEAPAVERAVRTEHSITLDGKAVHYTATAGTLLIRNDDEKPYGSMFYVAYTVDGAEPNTRPVTFLYNGGPGSASLWLHMGSVGPMRVVTDSPKATGSGPYQVVSNQYSLLDQSDLVFIDAPLTGYSRAVGKGTPKDFAGVDEDLKAFAKFIERYLTVNQRWNSPKFLFGESYGTTRSAGLSAVLQEDGVSLNGITLLSSVLNYNASIGAGLEVGYVNYLPSYTAIAFYHKRLPQMPTDMAAYVEQARVFARGEYAEALAQGDKLPPAQVDDIAEKLHQFTGLSVAYIKQANLRISPTRFRRELMRDDGEVLGRYDARFEGTEADNAGEYPDYDPSDTGISGAYVAAIHDYLSRDLKYTSDDEYKLSANLIGAGTIGQPGAAMAAADARNCRMWPAILQIRFAKIRNCRCSPPMAGLTWQRHFSRPNTS